MKFVDAGMKYSLPWWSVSGERSKRNVKILIFFDCSRNVPGSPELKSVESYARKKGITFPKIDYKNTDKSIISIFKPSDPSGPLVIYMPMISDIQLWNKNKDKPKFSRYRLIEGFDAKRCTQGGFCDTINFQYTSEQANKLMLQTEFNMVISYLLLKDVINWWIDQQS